ncbi:MAG: septum formation protein Maf [Spirochaetales bacterium]|nr:septum formation protein Maf [Spirochaetales bacterium]
MDRLILASTSPRRAEILEKFSIPFSVEPSPYEEIFTDEHPEIQVLKLSKNKVEALLEAKPELKRSVILGVDTCINLDGNIIGKPKSAREAAELLQSFSGRIHQVITGLTLYNGKNEQLTQDKAVTNVVFANLSEQEISWYLSTAEWKGAAGGYRIQDQGALLISSINGSWYNVMGLPIRLFYGMVAAQGLTLFRT